MQKNPTAPGLHMPNVYKENATTKVVAFVVDLKGIEPSTLRMRTVRSPKLSYKPSMKHSIAQNFQKYRGKTTKSSPVKK